MGERPHAGYLRAVRKLADFCKTSPDKITEDQLRRCFLHVKNSLKYAYGTLQEAFSGIKFFYTRTCKRDWLSLKHMKLQNVKSLPEVITRKQVLQIVAAARTERMAVYFWTVYSLGLRMQEGLNLQIGDIDAERGMVHVHRGKGAKDRYVPLPTSTAFQQDIKKITPQSDFGKKVSLQTMRHSHATQLLEAGVSKKAIQKYMGAQQSANDQDLSAPNRNSRSRLAESHRADVTDAASELAQVIPAMGC